jgi:hypothetical protein
MNALVSKFSTTDADSEIRTAMGIAEDDGLTDAMWGSQAGFGQLAQGHAFNIPPVPDVRFGGHFCLLTTISQHVTHSIIAHGVPEASYR